MQNVIKKIKANELVPNVLKELANTPEDSIAKASQTIDETDFNQATIWISSKLTVGGIESTLATGGLFFLFQQMADTDERRPIEAKLIDDLAVSRTQLNRCGDVWKQLGKSFIEEPQLKAYFVVEAAKKLSAANVDPMARQAAITMARRRQKVRIHDADELIAKFSTDAAESKEEALPTEDAKLNVPAVPKKRAAASLWKFAGKAINLLLQPAKTHVQEVDHAAIIRDLEAALSLYREQFAQAQQQRARKLKRPNLPKTQVSHV